MVNYAGSESHFIAGASNMRGLQSGQINPIYYALGSLLTKPATAANIAAANVITTANNLPAVNLPYAGYGLAAATSAGAGQATIGHLLTWMPQFSRYLGHLGKPVGERELSLSAGFAGAAAVAWADVESELYVCEES